MLAYETAGAEPAFENAPVAAPQGGLQPIIQKILSTTKTHKWYWAGGGALVVAALAVLFFLGVFGPGGKAICTAALTQAKDFGVISPSATLSSNSAESTDVKNRRKCSAQADNNSYSLAADLQAEDAQHNKCTDFNKQPDCVKLYSVARSDGMTTYQVREIPPNETDEALLGGSPPPAQSPDANASPDASPNSGASDTGGFDAPTAVDNGSAPPAQNPSDEPQQ